MPVRARMIGPSMRPWARQVAGESIVPLAVDVTPSYRDPDVCPLLIHPARAAIFDERALDEAWRDRVVRGAALDPWWHYPKLDECVAPSRFPFAALDNVVMTPHDSGSTDQTVERRLRVVIDNRTRFFRGEPLVNVVANAEPGDTLAVRFDRIWPNRHHGTSLTVIRPIVVDPEYVPSLPENAHVRWDIDLLRGVATLADPPPDLRPLQVPLDPMLGCFGVAAARDQAIDANDASTHGGNMDYRGFRQGVTVYLPAFAPGGLLFIGDGHAAQGDGEIVGTGIETSMDVTFTVRLLKGTKIGWPRAENDEDLLAVGNARPLQQAVQHATTELLKWLIEDYHLSPRAASTLLGQCIRYDVGNCYDPDFTMVAKIAKSWLP